MAPLRVLMPFLGTELGGSHVSALMLAGHLPGVGVEPVIALHRTDGPLAGYLEEIGLPFVAAPPFAMKPPRGADAPRALGSLLAALPRLRSWLREGAFDIVHTNDGRMHAAWGLASCGMPVRQLWHHRGDPWARGANWLAPFTADRIVSVSEFARPARPVLPLARRTEVIHSPFAHPGAPDRAAARARLASEIGCPADALILGYFGLLIARKRPQMMADIVRAVSSRTSRPVHAVLFGVTGAGSLAVEVEARAAELGVADRVHLAGHRRPVEPWMSGVDALVVPALGEPFGRTLIEAMLLGTPVVATRHGGNVEAIADGRTGHLVDPDDPAAFVGPLLRLRDDAGHRNTITETARREAGARFGIAQHVSRIAAIYRELAAEHRWAATKGDGPTLRTVEAAE